MNPSQWPALSEWDPDFQKLHDERPEAMDLPGTKTAEEVKQWRAASATMMKQMLYEQADFVGVEESRVDIPFRDGTSLSSLVFKPRALPAGGSPLAVLFHGGGWMVGLAEMEVHAALPLVKEHGAVVVSVEYRMAPEHPFPTPIDDSWDALQWCAANASQLGADPKKGFIIGGESAGGNIAAVLQHLARDKQLSPPLTGAWLGYPVTVCPGIELPSTLKADYTSYEQNAQAPILKKQSMLDTITFYKPDPTSHLVSPLLWPSGHAGLPKTYVQVCGMDVLRDDGLLYEQQLRRAGVETKLDAYKGLPHGFDLMFGQLDATQKFRSDRASAFKWLLG